MGEGRTWEGGRRGGEAVGEGVGGAPRVGLVVGTRHRGWWSSRGSGRGRASVRGRDDEASERDPPWPPFTSPAAGLALRSRAPAHSTAPPEHPDVPPIRALAAPTSSPPPSSPHQLTTEPDPPTPRHDGVERLQGPDQPQPGRRRVVRHHLRLHPLARPRHHRPRLVRPRRPQLPLDPRPLQAVARLQRPHGLWLRASLFLLSLSLSSRPACTTRPTDSLPPCRSARLSATQPGSSRTTTPTSSSTSSCVLVHLDSSALF